MSSLSDTNLTTTSSRRILSRNKHTEDESNTNNRQQQENKTISSNRLSQTVPIKTSQKEITENDISLTLTSQQQQQQHNSAANYINKEPFNEDIEIEESNLINDLKWRNLVINKFKEKIHEIKRLQTNPALNKQALKENYKQGLLLCASIKKLNRVSHMRVNKARNRTHEEKNKIDEYHLELQNLLYEISHLKNEINKCLEFRSLDEDINLVPIEEFYEKAPPNVSNPEITKESEHKLKLARLDWELIERQNMTGRIKELENQIELREKELKAKQNKLESLNPKLNLILEACKPTLDYFNTNLSDGCSVSEHVQYLPKPLYQLYMTMSAYKETTDKDIEIIVCGDLDEAKCYNLNDSISFDDDDSDSGNEEENENENYTKKKSKSKSKKKTNNHEKLFNYYPLTCKIIMNINPYGQMTLEFVYLNILKIVAVKSQINSFKEVSLYDNSLLKTENMFKCLYPKDDGLQSPNLANKFLFSNMGIKSIEPHMKNIGIPYRWCQVLCGLNYENKSDKNSYLFALNQTRNNFKSEEASPAKLKESDSSLMEINNEEMNATEADNDSESESAHLCSNDLSDSKLLEQIINRIKQRFKSRIVLQEIINSLKQLTFSSNEILQKNQFRFRVESSLISFKESTLEKYASFEYTQHLLNSGLVINENECSFYEIQLKNSDATLQAQIVINQDYPRVAPLFSVNINWNHSRNSVNDEAIRDMEREINIFRENFDDLSAAKVLRKSSISKIGFDDKNYDLLGKQINHLLVCFDIYIESESNYLENYENRRTKLFSRPVRGRDRKRPYSYLAAKDLFVQRMQFDGLD